MKTYKKRKTPKKAIIIIASLIIIIFSITTYLYFKTNIFGNNPKNNSDTFIDYNPPSSQQIQNGNDIKSSGSNTDKPAAPTVIEGSTKKKVDLVIINFSNTTLNVQINTVTSAGSCILTLTNPNYETITLTSNIQPLASVSACNTFKYAPLPAGSWTITVNYNSDSLTGNISDVRNI